MLRNIATALAGEIWAIRYEALEPLFAALDNDYCADDRGDAGSVSWILLDGVAHVPLSGYLLSDDEFARELRAYGIPATGAGEFDAAMRAAAGDSRVLSIVVDVSSPGGVASAAQRMHDAVAGARATKPVYAHGEDLVASAAYWAAAPANEIATSKSTLSGSIGVYRVLYDQTRRYENAGVKVHVIRTHELKGIGVQGAPITEAQLKAEQELLDRTFGFFVDDVAKGRGMDRARVMESATGQVWYADDAKARGLVDHVRTAGDTHARAAGSTKTPSVSPSAIAPAGPAGDKRMTTNTTGQAASPADELAAARREVEIARKEREIAEAALAEIRKTNCTAVIDAAAKAGRVAPSMRAFVDEYAALVGYDAAKVEAKLASLPVVTREAPTGKDHDDKRTDFDPPGSGARDALTEDDKRTFEAMGVDESLAILANAQGYDPARCVWFDARGKVVAKKGEDGKPVAVR